MNELYYMISKMHDTLTNHLVNTNTKRKVKL